MTPTRQISGFSSAGMVAALEQAWAAIQDRHGEVPSVVIVVGSGSPAKPSGQMTWGHYVEAQWRHEANVLPEVLIAGEGLAHTVDEVLATLLHEAAHGIASARRVQDTSRQGRWHNKRYKAIAEDLGLAVNLDRRLGWSATTLGPGLIDVYRDVLDGLDAAIKAYRHANEYGAPKESSRNGLVLVCPCGRKIRASTTVVAQGRIICAVCDKPFAENNTT
jgi:hypothetical protein